LQVVFKGHGTVIFLGIDNAASVPVNPDFEKALHS